MKINLLKQIYFDNEAKKENLVKRIQEAEAEVKVQREKDIKDLCSGAFKDIK